ncbi:class I SAM-dependent methyltransferase [Novosphingobium album (ex Hu et al. 2023)]|uniref:Class I SAM-dependent methyltransferase n=1 Tax=Novosphingobium album (ex Hu et al. 2023) TaxID=2930093 RepID=A0ABT0B2D1_9SPHN|nr:class I SAM-dependent methyltransferase [Novosphingobium album (ex Hu et al. 2023)]MCJ2179202.1 class I SAM-dependent methyltransferase [Novosphingobium album (ex Hu et al. 2023)]
MTAPNFLEDLLAAGRTARLIEDGIWSVMPTDTVSQPYDGRARLYDHLIGSRIYNHLAWGTSPASYTAFAAEAANSGTGPLLDAGCGTLVSTASVHAVARRPTVLVDLSTDMLRAARGRLVKLAGRVPDQVVLVQADLTALPFRDQAFGSVLCPGMLHLFEDVEAITRQLARVADPAASIFATSLVAERWLGKRYLVALYRAGEVARPRQFTELTSRLNGAGSGLQPPIDARIEGSMAFLKAQGARV